MATFGPPHAAQSPCVQRRQRVYPTRGAPVVVVAAAAQTSTAEAAAAAPTQAAAPYRVTDATIADVLSLYQSMLHEHDYSVPDSWVEGEIPRDLRGTYFRNGPGLQVANERCRRHTFDGDGMVLSFSFEGGRAHFRNQFVRTRGFLDEQAAGRPVHRTAFTRGAADGGLLFNPFAALKNVANTGAVHWGGRLLALYESGLPHELDPSTLDTLGESDLGGQLATPVLAAHYRVMPGQRQLRQRRAWEQRGGGGGGGEGGSGAGEGAAGEEGRVLVGFSFNTGVGGDAELMFYEWGEDGAALAPPQRYRLPGVSVALIHDIAVTEDYYVVVAGPVNFSPQKFLLEYLTSRCSIAECLKYDPSQPTRVHLVPRARGTQAGSPAHVIEAPPCFTFHHVNAFQATAAAGAAGAERQLVVLDTVAWDEVSFEASQHNLSPAYYQGGSRSQLRRLVLELDAPAAAAAPPGGGGGSGGGSGAVAAPAGGRLVGNYRLARRCVEFPCVAWDSHGAAHRHIYCCGDRVDDDFHWGPAQCVVKLTLPSPLAGTQAPLPEAAVRQEVWDAGPRRLVGEPVFVPRPDPSAEDDGYVLVVLHNAASGLGELAILDAQRVADGPVATIRLRHFLPAGLHGSWSGEVFGRRGGGAGAAGFSAEPGWREPRTVRAL